MMSNDPDVCCLPFEPQLWEGKKMHWEKRLFIKETLPQLFHIPWPPSVGKMITRMWNKAQEAGAAPDKEDFLWLAYDPSPWKSENYIAVTKEVPNAEMATLSGDFVSRVFDGPYSAVPTWIKAMEEYLENLKLKAKKYFFYYTTCPKCAKKYGHNYVVAFAQV